MKVSTQSLRKDCKNEEIFHKDGDMKIYKMIEQNVKQPPINMYQ